MDFKGKPETPLEERLHELYHKIGQEHECGYTHADQQLIMDAHHELFRLRTEARLLPVLTDEQLDTIAMCYGGHAEIARSVVRNFYADLLKSCGSGTRCPDCENGLKV